MKALCIALSFIFISNVNSQDSSIVKAENLLNKYFGLGQLNGNILVAENDRILLSKSFGVAEFDAREQLVVSSSFILASVCKSMTAVGVLKLVQQGKLNLDDRMVQYFPKLPYEEITIRHLLSNTSGIPEFRPLFADKWDKSKVACNNDVINILSELKPSLLFSPGSQFRYCNTGFVILASIIEIISGKSFEDYMKEEIFDPSGMDNTFIFNHEIQYSLNNFAFPYLKLSATNPVMVRPETIAAFDYMNYLDCVKGDVSTASTTEDIYKFDLNLVKGKILDPYLINEAFSPFQFDDSAGTRLTEGYGLGWFISLNKKGEKIVAHEGGMPGTSTFNYINLDLERFIIVLSNTNTTRSAQIAANLARIFDGEPVIEPKPYLAVEIAKYIEEKGEKDLYKFVKNIDKNDYVFTEGDINLLGYQFLQQDNTDAAIEIFRINVEMFPDSWNVYDSLGEGYMLKGDKESAIVNYKKSIELNPDNTNGQNFIKQLTNSE